MEQTGFTPQAQKQYKKEVMSELSNAIEVSFDHVAKMALSAHAPNATHDETKNALSFLRARLKEHLEIVEKSEAETKKGSDLPTPP
jgi:hypothetical protein